MAPPLLPYVQNLILGLSSQMAVAAMMGVPQVKKHKLVSSKRSGFPDRNFCENRNCFQLSELFVLENPKPALFARFCENPNPNRNFFIVPQVLIVRESSTGENGGMVTVKHLRRKEEAEVAWAEVPRYLLRARRTLTARESSRRGV